jgi:hypothetical protein
VRREPARHHRGLDAALIEATARVVAGDREVIVRVVERRDPVLERPGEGERIAVGGAHVRRPVLRFEARLALGEGGLAGLLARIDERVPAELARRPLRPRPEVHDVIVQEEDGVLAHRFALLGEEGRAALRLIGRVGQHVAEIGDRPGGPRPRLLRREVRHVRPRIEGLDEAGDVGRRLRPAELLHGGREP